MNTIDTGQADDYGSSWGFDTCPMNSAMTPSLSPSVVVVVVAASIDNFVRGKEPTISVSTLDDEPIKLIKKKCPKSRRTAVVSRRCCRASAVVVVAEVQYSTAALKPAAHKIDTRPSTESLYQLKDERPVCDSQRSHRRRAPSRVRGRHGAGARACGNRSTTIRRLEIRGEVRSWLLRLHTTRQMRERKQRRKDVCACEEGGDDDDGERNHAHRPRQR